MSTTWVIIIIIIIKHLPAKWSFAEKIECSPRDKKKLITSLVVLHWLAYQEGSCSQVHSWDDWISKTNCQKKCTTDWEFFFFAVSSTQNWAQVLVLHWLAIKRDHVFRRSTYLECIINCCKTTAKAKKNLRKLVCKDRRNWCLQKRKFVATIANPWASS